MLRNRCLSLLLGLLLVTGGAPLLAQSLVIAELHYAPAGDADEEFLELLNAGTTPASLAGLNFTAGITYTFTAGSLAPGGRVVVCRDRAKFAARYGNVAELAPGTYSGRLDNAGETVTLANAAGLPLFTVRYGVAGDWPARANALGSSLELAAPAADPALPATWRPSAEYGGSPGRAGTGPRGRLVINELLAHTDPPLEDAVELYNPGASPLDISGWYLSDSVDNPRKYRIPPGTVVPARGFRVIYEYQFDSPFPAAGDSPFTFNSARPDGCVILAADPAGNPLEWIDSVEFGPSINGVSFGRFPDGSGPWTTLSDLSLGSPVRAGNPPEWIAQFRLGPGASNAPPLVGPLVFTRLQYHPAIGADEFLELQNIGPAPLPLFDPAYPENRWALAGGIEFTFPAAFTVQPGEKFLVVPVNPEFFRARYGLPPATRIVGPYTNALNNAGERIEILRPDTPQLPPHPDAGLVPYVRVESVNYLPTAPWPVGASGTGTAIRRVNPAAYADQAANWTLDTPLPPTAPSLAASLPTPGKVRLSWAGQAGVTLVLEGRPDLSRPWQKLADLPAPAADGPQARDLDAAGTGLLVRLRVP